jgi:hypothetical protein
MGEAMLELRFSAVGILALAICGCEAGPQESEATAKSPNIEVPATPPNVAVASATTRDATKAYAEATKCFLDVSMRTMTDDPSGGPSSPNLILFDEFKVNLVQTGSRLGKTESEVMNEFRNVVADEAARVGAMSQSDQEQYVLTTHSNAIRCLEERKAEIAG